MLELIERLMDLEIEGEMLFERLFESDLEMLGEIDFERDLDKDFDIEGERDGLKL
jgi:hypothetical protein